MWAWISLDDADKISSVLQFILAITVLVGAALFYSGTFIPLRVKRAFANEQPPTDESTTKPILVVARVYNRTRYEQRIVSVGLMTKPRLDSRDWRKPNAWWARIRWRRMAHACSDQHLPVRKHIGWPDEEPSPRVPTRAGQLVTLQLRNRKDALNVHDLYVYASFDDERSACRRVRIDATPLVDPFAPVSPADSHSGREPQIAAAQAVASAAQSAAAAATLASAAANATVAAANAVIESLAAPPGRDLVEVTPVED